jgi:sigma-B regulation protein RsbU (phosphoserine phosphatase)
MRADLAAADQVQRSLLPIAPPHSPKVRVAWAFRPSQLVAGDGFNIFLLDEDHLGLYVLDVSGHGVQAALLAVTLNYMLHPHLGSSTLLKKAIPQPPYYEITSPAKVAQMLNNRFPMNPETNQYFTLLYGILDLQTYELRFVQAGHPRRYSMALKSITTVHRPLYPKWQPYPYPKAGLSR